MIPRGGVYVVKLIARSALDGLVPVTIGTVTVTNVSLDPVTMIAPFQGQLAKVDALLRAGDGIGFPASNRMESSEGVRILWAGQGRALLIGADAPLGLAGLAALTDQSDAFASAQVQGAGAVDVLARLVPVDLRLAHFPVGQTVRTFVNHMTSSVTRTAPDAFEVMVMRSMGQTLIHELTEAMANLAARNAEA
jgi:heterotetrameric sarcosine oxidase gamma subunit